jgi:helix-turn-helix protein
MGKRRPNPRLAKIHRNYTVEEIATVFKAHKNTVRRWIKDGLPTIDQRRPTLIFGRDLAEFLHTKRQKNKRPCRPDEIYCVRCKKAQLPTGARADYQAITDTRGNLIGRCPSCGATINRGISLAKLEQVCGKLKVTIPQARRHINQCPQPSVNSDLEEKVETHENAQPTE